MSYNIVLTNGQNLVTVADGTTDTNFTSLTLVGKNFAGYGAFLNENYVKLLENFSNTSSPPNPLQGQLYWNSTTKIMQVFNGTAWKSVSSSTSSAAGPSLPVTGDLWWDIVNGQLKVWGGSQWVIVGPAYTAIQGQTGVVAATVSDGTQSHIVVKFVVNNIVTAMFSKDPSFIVMGETGFNTINPGMTLASLSPVSLAYYGDANNALNLGGVAATKYMRIDQTNTTSFPISISNNAGLTVGSSSDFIVSVSTTDVNLSSLTQGKSLSMYVNVGGLTKKLVSLNGLDGSVLLAADPTANLGAATKQYVDTQVGGITSPILLRDGSKTITGTLVPDSNNLYNFGSATATFNTMYATTFAGTATNSLALGNAVAANYMRRDAISSTTVPLIVGSNSGITIGTVSDFSIDVTTSAVNVKSNISSKSLNSYVTIGTGLTIVTSFSGTTGLGTVIGDPVTGLGIATKKYVDNTEAAGLAAAVVTADGRYVLSGADGSSANFLTFGVNTLLTAAMSGKTIMAAAAVTFTLPNAALGLSYEIYPHNNTVTVTPQATSSLWFPDSSSTAAGASYTLTLASGAYGTSYIIETIDGTNWRLRTVGRTIVANAVNNNEAVAKGQADGRYVMSGADNTGANKKTLTASYNMVVGDSGLFFDIWGIAANSVIGTPVSNPSGWNVLFSASSTSGVTIKYNASGGGMFLPDGSAIGTGGSFSIPQNYPGSSYELREFGGSLYLRTSGRTVVANAVNANEAVALGQADARYVQSANGRGAVMYNSSSTWLCPANVTSVFALCGGGGGGGGGGSDSNSTIGTLGYGGGAGGISHLAIGTVSVTPGVTYSITVGAGGAGASISNTGSVGGTSSFSNLITSGGGAGGLPGGDYGAGTSTTGVPGIVAYPNYIAGGSSGGGGGGGYYIGTQYISATSGLPGNSGIVQLIW